MAVKLIGLFLNLVAGVFAFSSGIWLILQNQAGLFTLAIVAMIFSGISLAIAYDIYKEIKDEQNRETD